MSNNWVGLRFTTGHALVAGVLASVRHLKSSSVERDAQQAVVMGADLVRIADGVFSRYDLAQTLLNVRALIAQALAIF